jgi:hypothetical protein
MTQYFGEHGIKANAMQGVISILFGHNILLKGVRRSRYRYCRSVTSETSQIAIHSALNCR